MKIHELLNPQLKQGVYAGYNLSPESTSKLIHWAKCNNISNIYDGDSMHVTLAYSKIHFPFIPHGDLDKPLRCKVLKSELFGQNHDILVLLLDNAELHKRFKETIDAGAHFDYPNYQPHVTISNDPQIDNLDKLTKIGFPIYLVHEYATPLEDGEEWKSEVKTID